MPKDLLTRGAVGFAVDLDVPSAARALTGQHLHQLALAVSGNARNADDFVSANLQRQPAQRWHAYFIFSRQLANEQARFLVSAAVQLAPRGLLGRRGGP